MFLLKKVDDLHFSKKSWKVFWDYADSSSFFSFPESKEEKAGF